MVLPNGSTITPLAKEVAPQTIALAREQKVIENHLKLFVKLFAQWVKLVVDSS